MNHFEVPIAFFVYNRPECTRKSFDVIQKIKPRKLYVIADGPNHEKKNDQERCNLVRKIVMQSTADCQLITHFSDKNMGCKKRVSSGLNWVFQQEPKAIILEDDCVPDISFFKFCEELLQKYEDDPRIGMISGLSDEFSKKNKNSYFFSRYSRIWGWASWRRAWQYYDVEMRQWPEMKQKGLLRQVLDNDHQMRYWTQIFDQTHGGEINTWDYQWSFSMWNKKMLSIMPTKNLVKNIGFDAPATHTTKMDFKLQPVKTMDFPLKHPPTVIRDFYTDMKTERHVFSKTRVFWLKKQIKGKIKALMGLEKK